MRYYGFQNEVKNYLNRLQRETSVVITPSGAKTLNDRVESLKKSGTWAQYGLGFNDIDGDAYLSRASVKDLIGRSEVLWFIRGIKALGLYRNMVAWPMRSYQNIGTGSTVYSLGGLGVYNGTMVNSPVWGIDGTVFNGTNQRITISSMTVTIPTTFLSVALKVAQSSRVAISFGNNSSTTGVLMGHGAGGGAIQLSVKNNVVNGVGVTVGAFHIFGYSYDGTTAVSYNNGNTTTPSNFSQLYASTTTGSIGHSVYNSGDSNFWDGTIASAFVFSASLTVSTMNSIRTLYKNTVGTSLGLN